MQHNIGEPPTPHLVFEDRTGRRLWYIWAFISVITILTLGFAGEFAYRVYNLKLPLLESPVFDPYADINTPIPPSSDAISVVMKDSAYIDCGQGLLNITDRRTGLAGYLPYNDPTALAGLRAHCDDLDTVYYQAFAFGNADGSLYALGPGGAAFPLAAFNTGFDSRNRPRAFPVLAPSAGVAMADLGTAITGGGLLAQLAALDLTGVDGGFCIDMSGYPAMPAAVLAPFFEALNGWLAPLSLQSCLIGPMDAPFWADTNLMDAVGKPVLLGFQPTGNPASPTAAHSWFAPAADRAKSSIGAENMSVALGSFSALWKSGQRQAKTISYAEAMLLTSYFGGEVNYTAETGVTNARYLDANRQLNQIWILDAASFYNQRVAIGPVAEITIWPIGYEDPAIWALAFAPPTGTEAIAALEAEIDLSEHVIAEGRGPFSTHIGYASVGSRAVSLAPDGTTIASQTYSQIPGPRRVRFFGDSAPFALSITFSGLGSTQQTETLLNLLADYDIGATFFLSTKDLLLAGPMIEKLVSRGHIIATTTAPREAQTSLHSVMTTIQNNLAQQLLQDNYGHHALFVQNPSRYGQFAGDIAVLDQLQDLRSSGFFPVYSNIAAPRGYFEPLAFVSQLERTALATPASVVSFDFSAQNDASTNRALPIILSKLKADGFSFTTLAEMAGLTRDQVYLVAANAPAARDRVIYWFLQVSWIGVQGYIFLLALMITLQSPIYLLLAFLRRENYPYKADYRPPVTVIIPAYNEETVINKTLESVLASEYPDLKVIVVDDGSKDETAKVVAQVAGHDPRVQLIQQSNHGKWFAEDRAMDYVDTPIFVIVDADTLLQSDAIKYLVQPFCDEKVGAVAGTVEIGNRDNVLTAAQVIEYRISQLIVRRAYEVFNGILVVPGAIGAWRTEAVIKSGLVSGDTITEDADLTIAVHRSDYKVIYAPKAKSWTEAPNTVRAFMQQRLRWSLGMLQVSWKHMGAVAEGRPVGIISIINAIWYRSISSFVYPLVDIILAYAFFTWAYTVATQGFPPLDSISISFVLLFLFLTFLDAINLLAASWLDRKFEWKLMLLVPFLRFGYWQLIYLSSLRSIFHALSGRLRGWQKLKRTDTAKILEE